MTVDMHFILCIFIGTFSIVNGLISSNLEHVICRGTNSALAVSGKPWDHYQNYKRTYTNCTYVDGNLEITFLDGDDDYDLTFLENIEVVSGYVLIYSVFVQDLHLKNLRLIRGSQLYSLKGEKLYSLVVASNSKPKSKTRGVMQLGFKNLQDIMNGVVYFHNNNLLCYAHTILWADINPTVYPHMRSNFNNSYYRRPCEECDPACYNEKTEAKQCWGAGKDMCQNLNHRTVCSQNCDDRCFGTEPNQCCNPECAAGCTGPRKTDCFACKHFFNDGECVSRCPSHQIYNPYTFEMEENPKGKVAYGVLCQKDCPSHLLKDKEQNICVKTCRSGTYDNNGTCVECNGACPKSCDGNAEGDFITAANIHNFENCTIINGHLKLFEASFHGDNHMKIAGITVGDLEVLKNVKEITGYLSIQSNDSELQNLSFLSNLEVIHGREVDSLRSSLIIIFTQLRSIDLVSLKYIKNGHVTIAFNQHLCFVTNIHWRRFFVRSEQLVRLRNNKNETSCRKQGEICDDSCSDEGCFNKGADKCIECRNFKVDDFSNICINDCSGIPGLYEAGNDSHICRFCDAECESTCSGSGPENCDKCKHVTVIGAKDASSNVKKLCLKTCPDNFYPDDDDICQRCHSFCDSGCTGPSSHVMVGGCNSCALGIEQKDQNNQTIYNCIDPNSDKCPAEFYRQFISFSAKDNPLVGKGVCKKCHELCTECTGPDLSHCLSCKYLQQFDQCVQTCYPFYYADSSNICRQCNEQCHGSCFGPTAEDCKACKKFIIYSEIPGSEKKLYSCMSSRQEPSSESEDVNYEGLIVCAGDDHPMVQARKKADKDAEKLIIIAAATIGGALLVTSLLAFFCYRWRQRAKSQEYSARLRARMTGLEDVEDEAQLFTPPDRTKVLDVEDRSQAGPPGYSVNSRYSSDPVPEGPEDPDSETAM